MADVYSNDCTEHSGWTGDVPCPYCLQGKLRSVEQERDSAINGLGYGDAFRAMQRERDDALRRLDSARKYCEEQIAGNSDWNEWVKGWKDGLEEVLKRFLVVESQSSFAEHVERYFLYGDRQPGDEPPMGLLPDGVETCRPDANPEQTVERLEMIAEAGKVAKEYVAAIERRCRKCYACGADVPPDATNCPKCAVSILPSEVESQVPIYAGIDRASGPDRTVYHCKRCGWVGEGEDGCGTHACR